MSLTIRWGPAALHTFYRLHRTIAERIGFHPLDTGPLEQELVA